MVCMVIYRTRVNGHNLCHCYHTIYYVMPNRPYHMPCHTPPDNNTYYATPHHANTYTMRCSQGHTMPCPPDHTIYLAMSARSYSISCQAHQAIDIHVIPPGHIIYHPIPRQAIPYTMPARPYHTINPAMPGRPYHAMPGRPYHTPCHARQAILYTMLCR